MARFNRYNTPLLEPVVAWCIGIVAYALPDGSLTPYLLPILVFTAGMGIFILLWRLFFRRLTSWPRMAVWSLFFWGGCLTAALQRTDSAPILHHHSERLTFLGRVESIPYTQGRWTRCMATAFCYEDSVSRNWISLPEQTIRLYADTATHTALRIGDVIRFRGRIYAADSSGYDLYMRRTRGITARCFAWRVERIGTDTILTTRIEQLRARLGAQLQTDTTRSATAAASIMQALAIGNQSYIDPNLRESYSRTGVAHLLSVSGLHVGIVFLILNLLFGWMRLLRRGYIALGILVIGCLVGYAALTGLSPSVIRAVVMFSLLQIGLMLSRYTNSLNTLCAAALLLLVWNPYNLYHIGFQLSFAAMVGIITLYQPIARRWMPQQRILRWLWSLTLVGITAQIGTFPLVMYHFGQLQLAGLLLNPVIWFTVPVIIGGSLLYLVSHWAWVMEVTRTVTEWQNSVIQWMGSHSWVAVTEINLPVWGCAALYSVILGVIIWINRHQGRPMSYLSDASEEEAAAFRAAK